MKNMILFVLLVIAFYLVCLTQATQPSKYQNCFSSEKMIVTLDRDSGELLVFYPETKKTEKVKFVKYVAPVPTPEPTPVPTLNTGYYCDLLESIDVNTREILNQISGLNWRPNL